MALCTFINWIKVDLHLLYLAYIVFHYFTCVKSSKIQPFQIYVIENTLWQCLYWCFQICAMIKNGPFTAVFLYFTCNPVDISVLWSILNFVIVLCQRNDDLYIFTVYRIIVGQSYIYIYRGHQCETRFLIK